MLSPEEERSVQDATKSFAAPPKAAAPLIQPPAEPKIAAPSEPIARPPAVVRSAPKMAAPGAPPPQPQMAPPIAAPAAPQTSPREPVAEDAQPTPGAPAPVFDDVRSALPEGPPAGDARSAPQTDAAPPPTAAEPLTETEAAPSEPAAAAPEEMEFEPAAAAPDEPDAAPPPETGAAPREAADLLEEAEPRPSPSAAPAETSSGDPAAESARETTAEPRREPDPSSVLVHFATNRNRLAPKDREWLVYFRGFFTTLPAFVVYGVMLLAILILPWFGKRAWAGYALVTGALVLCAMGSLEAYVRSQLRDELTGELYGSRPTELSYGACEISVPLARNRQPGELNRPVSVWIFEAPQNPEKHFMLRRVVEHADKEAFHKSLTAEIEKSGTQSALLFLHGYNVSFEDALFRTAQLTVDLKFPGAAIAFSWPSYADPVKYTFDEQNAEVSIPALRELLQDVTSRSGATRIHVIAHSMGNRVLAGALRTMDREAQERNKKVIREIVLAAPDIDRRVFESQVLPHVAQNTQHCTLYASSRDRALLISRYFHNYQRLGETEPELIVAHGMDTIDASLVDTSLLGHSYIGDVQSIVSDLHELVVSGKRPVERLGLEALQRGELLYWAIKPRLETATDAALRR
jgi:esterase/lipase superfamily enzyme